MARRRFAVLQIHKIDQAICEAEEAGCGYNMDVAMEG